MVLGIVLFIFLPFSKNLVTQFFILSVGLNCLSILAPIVMYHEVALSQTVNKNFPHLLRLRECYYYKARNSTNKLPLKCHYAAK